MSKITKTRFCHNREDVKEIGDYWFDRHRPDRPCILIMLPGDVIPSYLRLFKNQPAEGEDRSWWTLTGPDLSPTLSPSINNPGVWHGHLVDGELRQC